MTGFPARALVVGAHHDDCEFGAGATVARWAAAGTEVSLAVLTDGSRGSHDPAAAAETLRDARETEQLKAAGVLGLAGVRFLRAVDGELAASAGRLREEVGALIRELRPEVVITHDPWARYDLHPDHAVAGRIVVDALYDAREPRAAPTLAARGLTPWRPDELLLWGAPEPDRVEPAGEEWLAAKVRALLCHRSQYVTSFGLDPAHVDEPALVARVRARMTDGGDADGGSGPAERFKALALPDWPTAR